MIIRGWLRWAGGSNGGRAVLGGCFPVGVNELCIYTEIISKPFSSDVIVCHQMISQPAPNHSAGLISAHGHPALQ